MEHQHEEIILARLVGDPIEESPELPPSAQEPAVLVVGIDIALELEVEGKPVGLPPPAELPSPALSDDGQQFMELYDGVELLLLQDWMEHTRKKRGGVGYHLVEPLISRRLKTFLRSLHGQ